MKITEDEKNILKYGAGMGALLFIANVIYIGLQRDREFALKLMPDFFWLYLGYTALGMVFFWFYIRREPKKNGFWKYCLQGSAGIYTIMNLMPLPFLLAVLFIKKEVIRGICLIDGILLCGFLIYDYAVVWKMSKKLNKKRKVSRVLWVDIEEAPKTVDEFAAHIAEYCGKNHSTLEFLVIGKEMEIRMDGEYYKVVIEQTYSQFGPMYGMKFIQTK